MGKGTAAFNPQRFYVVISLIGILVVSLTFRIFNLSILKQDFLQREGDERTLRLISAPAFRGMIMDRNGFPLAVSTTVYSAWINPQVFSPSTKEFVKLAALLKMNPKEIKNLDELKKKREFVYLKRTLSPPIAQAIRQLNIAGLNLQKEYHRYYPEGEVMAHVIGFTNVDDHGQEGIELGYNNWLAGVPGKKWVLKDRLGQVISDVDTVQEQKPGHDLVLSIDRRIQYLAYRELLNGVTQNHAVSGSVIVLDTRTGEVLAMVNQPSYNPNNRTGVRPDYFRNRAVTDIFEPGSTIKAFTVMSGLETGTIEPNSDIDTTPGYMRLDKSFVRDERNNGILSIAKILQLSSNMGAAKIALSLPTDALWSVLSRVGFGEFTGVNFPGEQNGSLTRHNPWGKFVLATLSFGYGLSTTALQLSRAYAVIANDGVKLPLSLLRVDQPPQGQQIISPDVTVKALTLLESVVKSSKGKHARVQGYRVAGKTGTSRKVGTDGYEKHYTSSFVGIAPVSNPRLVVAVVINDPQGKDYLGAKVSAPVFAKIMEGTLRLLDMQPDEGQAA